MNAFRAHDERGTPPPPTDPHAPTAIVIGSGFGGLAAAIRLSCKGWRVRVLEKLESAGGRAAMHHQDGFSFDAGPTIITAPFLLEELWTLCGRRMEDHIDLRRMDPFYRIRFDDGTHFDYSGDPQAMEAEVARFAPDDAPLAQRFARALLDEGVYVKGFFFPVVPKGQARIRVQLSAAHEPEHLDRAIAAFTEVGHALGVLK